MVKDKTTQIDYFRKAQIYNRICKIVFLCSLVGISIMGFIKDRFYYGIATTIAIGLLLIVVILEKVKEEMLFKAENIRRRGYFDNSFNTRFNEKSIQGYYDSDEVSYGMYKMAVNLFENVMYSKEIARRMKTKVCIVNAVLFSIILVCASYGIARVSFAIPLIQLFLSKEFILNWYDINKYCMRMEEVYEKMKILFDKKLCNNSASIKANTAEVIKLYMDYEVNIVDSKILLDTRIFNRLNESLMKEWEEIKDRYQIK